MLGYRDEVWRSRPARPDLHAWAGGEPMRLREPPADPADPDPEALAGYGLMRGDTGGMRLRFVAGRPVGRVAEDFLARACGRPAAEGKTALLLVRDNAAWHVSARARARIEAHDRRAKAEGGVRVVACYLPVKAPRLDAIEPKWVHGKRAIIEPDRKPTAVEVEGRVCAYYGCEPLDRIAQEVT